MAKSPFQWNCLLPLSLLCDAVLFGFEFIHRSLPFIFHSYVLCTNLNICVCVAQSKHKQAIFAGLDSTLCSINLFHRFCCLFLLHTSTRELLIQNIHWKRLSIDPKWTPPRYLTATPKIGASTPLTFALDNPAPRQAVFLSLPVRVGTQTTKNQPSPLPFATLCITHCRHSFYGFVKSLRLALFCDRDYTSR